MAIVLAWALVGLAAAAGWAAARSALAASGRDRLALAVTAPALAAGILTQLMLWIALLLPGRLTPGATLAVLGVAVAAGARWWRGRRRPMMSATAHGEAGAGGVRAVLAVAVAAVCAAILVGAALWPFAAGDALAVYGPLGRMIAATGALPIGEGLYEAYPMLVPMLFAVVEWLAGRPDEYLSRLVTAALAVGAVAGAGWLAREVRTPRAGWLAAALLAASPVYSRWATSGYADVPAGLFVVLAAVLAWRWWRGRALADALLCGVAAGLAMWTKNSALTLLATGPLLFAAWWWSDRAARRRQATGTGAAAPLGGWRWSHVAVAGAVAAVVAAPFYARNLVLFGLAVPATVWSDSARRDLAGLLDPLLPERGFGVLGWAAAAALLLALGRFVRRRGDAPVEALFLAVIAPFVAAWWWWASYDPRFLVTVLPVAAAFAGVLLDEALEHVERAWPRRARWATWVAIVALLVVVPAALRAAVQHKRALLARPFMGDNERHRLQVGGLFEVGRAIGRLPAGVRVGGVPAMARYYLEPERLPFVAWASADEAPCAGAFDYRVVAASPRDEARRAPCLGTLVLRTEDGWELVAAAPARSAGEDGGR